MIAIAIMSYNGQMNFGLLGDYDAMDDIGVVVEGIEASLDELLALVPAPEPESAAAGSNGHAGAHARTPG